jgi:DNA-binding NtrC family response regulator
MPSSRVSGARFDQLLYQVREPAFWLGPDLRIAWVNRAFEELTGFRAADAVGLVCRAHGPTREGDLDGLAGSFFPPAEALAGQACVAKTLVVNPGGERQWRCVEHRPFHTKQGELAGVLCLVRMLHEAATVPESASQRLRVELMEARDRLLTRHGLEAIVGRGPEHRRLTDQITAAAATAVPVLIVGEPGTGKRLVAHTIHQLSQNRRESLVPLDCAALPPDVLERTLFGISLDNGGPAVSPRLALPAGSTLLIGDILDLPRDLQGRLVASLDPSIRLIATTHDEPDAAFHAERLRGDFYFMLTTLVIRLRPLRERLDELSLFSQHFLERANIRGERQRHGFHPEALRALALYDWPGNLRELSRAIDESHAHGTADLIGVDDLPMTVRGQYAGAYVAPPPLPPATLDDLLTQVEHRLIEAALQRARHNKSKAADLLGISRPRLYRRIKELNIPEEAEPSDETSPSVPEAI